MNDLAAALLSLILISPALTVLFVLIARRLSVAWEACAFPTTAKRKEKWDCGDPHRRTLCHGTS